MGGFCFILYDKAAGSIIRPVPIVGDKFWPDEEQYQQLQIGDIVHIRRQKQVLNHTAAATEHTTPHDHGDCFCEKFLATGEDRMNIAQLTILLAAVTCASVSTCW